MIRQNGRLLATMLAMGICLVAASKSSKADKQVDDGSPGRMTWGVGDHYTLPTDASGWSIVEPGQRHRIIYAAADGSKANSGLTPDDPVDLRTGFEKLRIDSSDWLLLKRGDTFDRGIGFGRNMRGESPLHPLLIAAYGDGPRPVVRGKNGAIKSYPRGNIVIRDLHLVDSGFSLNPAGVFENVLIENVLMDNASSAIMGTSTRVTIRRCVIKNCHREEPKGKSADDGWARNPLGNRHQGIFANHTRSLLIEQCVLDHNGWEAGYFEEGGGPDDPQPPSMYSHNLYLSTKNRDLTVRWNINARAASQALRDGSGQFYVGNVMIANNIGGYSGPDGGDGNYTTFTDNVLIHPAAKRAPRIGGRGWGWSMKDVKGSEAIRNIFAHAAQGQNDLGLKKTEDVLVEEYVRYAWHDQDDLNPTGRPFPDPDRTLPRYDRQRGSGEGTIEGFLAEAALQQRGHWRSKYTAEALVEYFQQGFGIWPGRRTEPSTLAFSAEGGDGVRWDNWRNWSTGDLPIDGDRVRLVGREVYFSGTRRLASLHLDDALLRVRQGMLAVGNSDGLRVDGKGGHIELDRSGVLSTSGVSGQASLHVDQRNGQWKNWADISADTTLRCVASGGQCLLAGSENTVTLGNDGVLEVVGDGVAVGYHGTGTLRLQDAATLKFVCGPSGVSTIRKVSGGDDAVSTFSIGRGEVTLAVDTTHLAPGTYELRLVKVDRLQGTFSKTQIPVADDPRVRDVKVEHDEHAGEVRLRITIADKAQP